MLNSRLLFRKGLPTSVIGSSLERDVRARVERVLDAASMRRLGSCLD
jgi:hypothetical protein